MKSIDINDFLELPTFIMIAGTKTPKDAKANPFGMNSFLHFFFGRSEFSVVVVDESDDPILVIRKTLGEIGAYDYDYVRWEIATVRAVRDVEILNCDFMLQYPEDERTFEEYDFDYKSPPLPIIPKEHLASFRVYQHDYQIDVLSRIIRDSKGNHERIFVSEYYDVYLEAE